MRKVNNLKGGQFGKLTVIERAENRKGRSYWRCICECETVKEVRGSALTSGNTKTCGCSKRKHNKTHGMSHLRLYKTWTHMMGRCYSENYHNFANYGGRGVTVYEPWKDFIMFYRDVVHMYNEHALQHGEKETTLDRIDSNGNYEPSNVRFATYEVQANNRRNNKSA
ncbi:hypothetical protein MUN88_19135 [Gracilibacillus caseinilyticus]|uniref:AP2 domain-containing protein n=1 Tax=Gracilibacillus caseinilyticus TaxID=2932256 RepID=A0ABY4EWX1_9BACI|nr:hypothetical protein [Gracilibacillus caseinilyticus]UOQ48134.1 hypothetical protein MUN88_19135 [Gracilibacillus caseinilyticus]